MDYPHKRFWTQVLHSSANVWAQFLRLRSFREVRFIRTVLSFKVSKYSAISNAFLMIQLTVLESSINFSRYQSLPDRARGKVFNAVDRWGMGGHQWAIGVGSRGLFKSQANIQEERRHENNQGDTFAAYKTPESSWLASSHAQRQVCLSLMFASLTQHLCLPFKYSIVSTSGTFCRSKLALNEVRFHENLFIHKAYFQVEFATNARLSFGRHCPTWGDQSVLSWHMFDAFVAARKAKSGCLLYLSSFCSHSCSNNCNWYGLTLPQAWFICSQCVRVDAVIICFGPLL